MGKFIFLFVCIFTVSMASAQQVVDTSIKPVVYPKGFTAQLNLVYTKVNNWDGRMDLYLPPQEGKPTPIVINIHGGGWNHGTKEQQTGFNTFFKAGFAVANIEYRMTPQATAPAAIEDTRCALIYLIMNDQGADGPTGGFGWETYREYFHEMAASWNGRVTRSCQMGRGRVACHLATTVPLDD